MKNLTFKALSEANTKRLPKFKDANGQIVHLKSKGSDWSTADWFVAIMGELGEAANIANKIRRGDFSLDEAKEDLQKEFADIIIYLDITAKQLNIDLGEVVRNKFNEKSKQLDIDVFI